VLAELARAEALAPGGLTSISLPLVIRAENLANRTLKRLGLAKPTCSKRVGPSLQDVKARYAQAPTTTGEAGG
jgi:hypothetical protein